jgi:hypothetical protein
MPIDRHRERGEVEQEGAECGGLEAEQAKEGAHRGFGRTLLLVFIHLQMPQGIFASN